MLAQRLTLTFRYIQISCEHKSNEIVRACITISTFPLIGKPNLSRTKTREIYEETFFLLGSRITFDIDQRLRGKDGIGNTRFSSHLLPDTRVAAAAAVVVAQWYTTLSPSYLLQCQTGATTWLQISALHRAPARSYTVLYTHIYIVYIYIYIYLHRWPFQRVVRVSYVYVAGSCAAEPCQYWFSI